VVQVLRSVYDAMVNHALDERPNECCGLLAGSDGVITRIYRASNVAEPKTVRYDVDSGELVRIFTDMREKDVDHLGIYHSHPNSEPRPSATDRKLARYDSVVYFIVSLRSRRPRVEAWRMRKNRPEDEDAEVTDEAIEIVERAP
jgi:[CysO sulfur-carrier protein]-S-L-cysteine hydrolase